MPARIADLGSPDAIVIGAGPNGLAAAIVLAQAGCSVTVVEAAETVGGSCRSAELTLPGFLHDVCSAVHPLALGSPFFQSLPLEKFGLKWVQPPAPLAHPLDDGTAFTLERSVEATAERLGVDGRAYHNLFSWLTGAWEGLKQDVLAPLQWPRHPLDMARFAALALRSARGVAESSFRTAGGQALFCGLAAHSLLPLEKLGTAGFALVLASAGHTVSWPLPRGGAQRIADALASYLASLGGRIVTGWRVESLEELPPVRAILCDLTPRQLLRAAGERLPAPYRRKLERFRYGPGVFKVDWALEAPIPWQAEDCTRAGTVHLGGRLEEIAISERAAWVGRPSERPFVLLAQPSRFDPGRAPAGKHTAWAYCHVPHGSAFDMLERMEAQVERFAPGFRKLVVGRSVMGPRELEQHNPNLVGGDINGGSAELGQFFLRPTAATYSTPAAGLYLCSSSTPPGGGVHGMCGYHAARRALREVFGADT